MYNRRRIAEQRPNARPEDPQGPAGLFASMLREALHGKGRTFSVDDKTGDPYADVDERNKTTPLGPGTRWRGREDSRGFPAADNSGDEGKSLEYRQYMSDETNRLDMDGKLESPRDEYDYMFVVKVRVPEGKNPQEFGESIFPDKEFDSDMNYVLFTCGDEGEATSIANRVRGSVEKRRLKE